jgi:hypothetical protein
MQQTGGYRRAQWQGKEKHCLAVYMKGVAGREQKSSDKQSPEQVYQVHISSVSKQTAENYSLAAFRTAMVCRE